MRMLRLVLAAEHNLFRAGLKALLNQVSGVKVVGETSNGREVVVLARNLKPAVVLLDYELSQLNGLEAAVQILHFSPTSRIVMMLPDANSKAESRALEAGVAGVLSRQATFRDLEGLLQTVQGTRRERAIPAEVVLPPAPAGKGHVSSGGSALTPRQHQVLKLLAEGGGVKKIARFLGISPKTVETHRAQIMERLHIYDLVGLVRYALKHKITRL
jgi:DNA-binding NarL/FixJ family response regulator